MRETRDVIDQLFTEMRTKVISYDENVIPVDEVIDGTAFFPGGTGLWRGTLSHGVLPKYFPERSIMLVGHNFDKVEGYRDSVTHGIEKIGEDGQIWKYMLRILSAANVTPEQCFFTNLLMGLKPLKARGKMGASVSFVEECIQFLDVQVQLVQPRLVVLLGDDVKTLLADTPCSVKSMQIAHPHSLFYKPGPERTNKINELGMLLSERLLRLS